ncbi:hypothetical protein ACJW30_12G013700 [Castanea mollissima]
MKMTTTKKKKKLMSSAPQKSSRMIMIDDSLVKFLQRVFGIDTIVKPLPPAMAYNVSSNLNFFMCIVTQFFDPEGIANAQKSLGIGQEEKARRVR